MNIGNTYRAPGLRLRQLALCLGVTFALGSQAAFANVEKIATPPQPQQLSAAKLAVPHRPAHPTTTFLVTSCDDAGPNTLRDAAGVAIAGDTIDLSTLACSTISLTSGSIAVSDVTIVGPGQNLLDIDASGNGYHSVFYHFSGGGSLLIEDVTISGAKYEGTNGNGGCIWSSGDVALSSATVNGCEVVTPSTSTSESRGGGIYADGSVTLLFSTVSNNFVDAYNPAAKGGGIYAKGGIISKYSTIDGNDAVSSNYIGRGGGVYVVGNSNAYFLGSTISNNSANSINGGMEIRDAGSMAFTLVNSTISGNRTDGIQAGAGVYMHPYVANSTVAFNSAASASFAVGFYVQPIGEIESSLFANNMADDGTTYDVQSINGSFTGSSNLITATGSSVPLDTVSACPNLGPLADNGGGTLTHSIGLDSAAIDGGNDVSGVSNDQRGSGFPRLFGDAPDIGAFENQGEAGDRLFFNGVDSICQ
jgi:predicted outer membrane repeat protein